MNSIKVDEFIDQYKTDDKSGFSIPKINIMDPEELYRIAYHTNDAKFQDDNLTKLSG